MLLNNLELDVLEEFTKDYSIKLTGSFIAKKKGLNQKTVSTFLKNLEDNGFLKSTTEGKNKLYCLNLDNHLFLNILESSKTIRFYKKNHFIKELLSKIEADIIIIFGSYAKGIQKKDSDLDIAIIGEVNKDSLKQAEKIYQIEINAKIFTKSNFTKKDILAKEIIKDHIIIKGYETFVDHLISLSD